MKVGDAIIQVPKTKKGFDETERKKIKKNYKAKNILVCGIGTDNRISVCQTTKEIWDCLQTTHEETTQVKQSKVDMMTNQYETLTMQEDESIQELHTRFTAITNEFIILEKLFQLTSRLENF